MRLVLVPAALAAVLCFGASAVAQPSYSCSGRLNATERAICGDAGLSQLDSVMAGRFFAIFDRLDAARQATFRHEQTQWRADRDACGAATGCIRANYVFRIAAFDAMEGVAVPERFASATVLPDGSIQRVAADGSRTIRRPDGTIERYLPNGEKLPEVVFAQVQPSDLPELPPLSPSTTAWFVAFESTLLSIIENILTDAEYVAYQPTETGKEKLVLIDWRLRSIAFLTQP